MHAPPEVPPASWIDDMRTPPLDVVLGQFRAQKGGPAAADGAAPAEPPPPAEAADAASAEPSETPRSGALGSICPSTHIPLLGMGLPVGTNSLHSFMVLRALQQYWLRL